MRKNLPVTQRELEIPDGATLMSTTDVKGRVTYANDAFVRASGFERNELIGKAHNIVRHPDMPEEAYKDLWRTIQSGHSWSALVKNRCKNGDYYWVRANVTPVFRGGVLQGYMSVRTKASATEIAAAEKLYADFRGGRAGGKRFERGQLMRKGALSITSMLNWLPVRWRIRLAFLGAATVVAMASVLSPAAGMPTVTLAALLVADVWLERQVAKPLSLILRQAASVAAGQLHTHEVLNRVDEIGLILRATNQAGLNLAALVADVGAQVGGMETASREIAAGNNDLSVRTEQAAANLEQTAAAMEQLSATVQNNASSARQAADAAHAAAGVAQRGGALVQQAVSTMSDVARSSKGVEDIVSVIDSIAWQTNLLALNAAVEAARAGEQGKGFSVVAAEVRVLARRCADAAKDIRLLISNSAEQMKAGSQRVEEAGRAVANLLGNVESVSRLIAAISSASAEQSSGLAQIGIAVGQLDQTTQQNAALVEQSAAAALSLQGQAARLSEAVSVWKHTS